MLITTIISKVGKEYSLPVLSTLLVSMLHKIHSFELRFHGRFQCTFLYASESTKHSQQLSSTQPLQQSSKLGAVANSLSDLMVNVSTCTYTWVVVVLFCALCLSLAMNT